MAHRAGSHAGPGGRRRSRVRPRPRARCSRTGSGAGACPCGSAVRRDRLTRPAGRGSCGYLPAAKQSARAGGGCPPPSGPVRPGSAGSCRACSGNTSHQESRTPATRNIATTPSRKDPPPLSRARTAFHHLSPEVNPTSPPGLLQGQVAGPGGARRAVAARMASWRSHGRGAAGSCGRRSWAGPMDLDSALRVALRLLRPLGTPSLGLVPRQPGVVPLAAQVRTLAALAESPRRASGRRAIARTRTPRHRANPDERGISRGLRSDRGTWRFPLRRPRRTAACS